MYILLVYLHACTCRPDSGDYHKLEKPKNTLLDKDLTCLLEEEEQDEHHTEDDPGRAQSEQSKPQPCECIIVYFKYTIVDLNQENG